MGIAIASDGENPQFQTLGAWSTGVAWSTIKVPLAIAAERSTGQAVQSLVVPAITESDNAAAEQLWSMLGEPHQAARSVETVLRDGGDQTTKVQSQRIRPPFTAFGQTEWTLAQQAILPPTCLASQTPTQSSVKCTVSTQASDGVWPPSLMSRRRAAGDQTITAATWYVSSGPLPTPSGWVGVALAAKPFDGTFDSGVKALTALSNWLHNHRQDFPGADC